MVHRGIRWPDHCWSKSSDGSWVLFGRPYFYGPKMQARFMIEPESNCLHLQFHEDLPLYEFPLDGRWTSYVPLIQAYGSAKFRCLQRSQSTLIAETLFPDGLVFGWELKYMPDFKKCTLSMTNQQTGDVGVLLFQRKPISSFPSKAQLLEDGMRKRNSARDSALAFSAPLPVAAARSDEEEEAQTDARATPGCLPILPCTLAKKGRSLISSSFLQRFLCCSGTQAAS